MDKTPDRKLGHYELISRVSDGAQAAVYEARSVKDGEIVALKLFKEGAGDSSSEMRFKKESEILKRLSHRNIVKYKDSFSVEGEWEERQCCLAMEFMKGETLKERLKKFPKGMPWPQAKDMMEQVLAGLIYAGENDVVHRDIKPSNIFILDDGQVRLFDFGIARMAGETTKTGGGSCMGSFDYMAPDFALSDKLGIPQGESFRGDHLSDIFSLTVVFYEMLTGALPWGRYGDRPELEYLAHWRAETVRAPSHAPIAFRVIRHLTGFIDKGLSVDRTARFQSFGEMIEALRDIRLRVIKHKNKDEYELLEGLDKGGFGEVYRAKRIRDGKIVAIKRLFTDRASRRFLKEAEILRKYFHPNLVEYVDFFENVSSSGGKQLFLVMEFLQGMPQWSLRNRIRDNGALDPGQAAEYFRFYLDALQYLHENVNQIIHRDIKPGNLYAPLDSPSKAKILDLGVARDVSGTETHGAAPGTWDYMAPEFVTESARGTPQTDLYSLGLSFYEAVAGTPAFPRTSKSGAEAAAEFVARATGIEKTVVAFDANVFREHPTLEQIIKKAIHRNPLHRFSSAAEMRLAVLRFLKEMGRAGGEMDEFEDAGASSQPDAEATRAATMATMFGGPNEPLQEWQAIVAEEKNKRRFRRGIAVATVLLAFAAAFWFARFRLPDIMPVKPPPPPAVPSAQPREPAPPAGSVPEIPAAIPATADTVPGVTAVEQAEPPQPPVEPPAQPPAKTQPEAQPPAAIEPVNTVPAVTHSTTESPAPSEGAHTPPPTAPTANTTAARQDREASLLRDLTRELRLLRMRSIVSTSYEAFHEDAAARIENARLLMAQPEYAAINAREEIAAEMDRLWLHVADNALSRYLKTNDGQFLGAARGALWDAAEALGDRRKPEVIRKLLARWNGLSPGTDFALYLPLPRRESLAGSDSPKNVYLEGLLESEDFSQSPASMLPRTVTVTVKASPDPGFSRQTAIALVLVPAAKKLNPAVEDSFYLARDEITLGAMRCFRDGAKADLERDPSLSRHFTGQIDLRSLVENDYPYCLRSIAEALEFCNWLSHRTGFGPVYARDSGGKWTADFRADGFRLPTEAEWEYSARLGTDLHPAPGSSTWQQIREDLDRNHSDDLVWYYYKDGPRSVTAEKRARYPLGFFDLCGNVGELAMRHTRWQDMEKERPGFSVCGGNFRHRTAEKVSPSAREPYSSAENAGFRPLLPVRTDGFER